MITTLEQFLEKFDEKLRLNDKVAVKWNIFVSNRDWILLFSVMLGATAYLINQLHIYVVCAGAISGAMIFFAYYFVMNDQSTGGLVFALLTAASAGFTVMLAPRTSVSVLMLNGFSGAFLILSLINFYLLFVRVRIKDR